MKTKLFYLFALIVLVMICWQFVGFLWGFHSALQNTALAIALAIACLLFSSALVLAARKMSAGIWIYAGLLVLLGLFLPASMLIKIFPASGPEPFGSYEALALILILSIALIVAALLLYSGQVLYKEWQHASAPEDRGSKAPRRHAILWVFVLLLGALLLAKALHSLYWLMIWDLTTDPLGYFWLVIPIFVAIFSGVILSITLPGWAKLGGLFYSLLIIALMIAVSARAQRVDFRQLTEERAERVSRAIESYYSREGRYPQNLRQLVPGYALSLPGPVIIFGQGWCYDGGDDYYRLGYVDRQHWSDPRLIGRIYTTEGEAPDLHPMCEQEVAALHNRYPKFPYTYWKEEGE
jgi:hypothetical protein